MALGEAQGSESGNRLESLSMFLYRDDHVMGQIAGES